MQQELVIKVAWWTKKICESINASRIFLLLQGGAHYLHEKRTDFLMFICRQAEKTAVFV
jgi:hypothetical protein